MYSKKNDIGTISVSKNVLGNIVADAVKTFDGRLVLCNSKGKISPIDSMSIYFLDIDRIGGKTKIKIYVLVKFGAGIKQTTNQLIEFVNCRLDELIGNDSADISVVIKGVFSKNVTKRNIEVKK
ncbi:MAG: hypothetical protein HFG67_03355 [Firmicutes bacterium]|nr:hypothetical protein [Bacillota bacterium]